MIEEPRRLPYGWRIVAGDRRFGADLWRLASGVGRSRAAARAAGAAADAAAPAGSRRAQAGHRTSACQQRQRTTPTPPPAANAHRTGAAPRRRRQRQAEAAGHQRRADADSPARGPPCPRSSPRPGKSMAAQPAIRAWCCAPAATPASPSRDRMARLMLNRDLAAGRFVQVPNIDGLSLATSNAGAVELWSGRPGHGPGRGKTSRFWDMFRLTRNRLWTGSITRR